MSLTTTEYRELTRMIGDIRTTALSLEGLLEKASSILIGVEDRHGTWAAPIHVEMGAHRESVAIIEELARTKWGPAITAHPPRARPRPRWPRPTRR